MIDKGWVGFDLDGTLAHYETGYAATMHIGKPIPRTVARLKAYLADGFEVRIFTARVDGGEAAASVGHADAEQYRDVAKITATIQEWCVKHIGVSLAVTNKKDFRCVRIYDDRAKQVEFNTGRVIGEDD